MVEKLSLYVEYLLQNISSEIAFTVSVGVVTIGLAVNLLITFFSTEYKRKNRVWFCLLGSASVLFQVGLCLLSGKGKGYPLILCALVLLYCIPVFFVSNKKRKMKKEQLELVQFIDQSIKRSALQDAEKTSLSSIDTYSGINQQVKIESKNLTSTQNHPRQDQPDFTHVCNVIERLSAFPLTPNDKKQVKELEFNIRTLKTQGNSQGLKSKINDGLGALLKIMSKYGV